MPKLRKGSQMFKYHRISDLSSDLNLNWPWPKPGAVVTVVVIIKNETLHDAYGNTPVGQHCKPPDGEIPHCHHGVSNNSVRTILSP